MNIYLLTQNESNGWWDSFDSIIVAAKTEEDAKSIHPWDGKYTNNWGSKDWASKPENVTAKLIGIAIEGIERGVILSSINAG